MKQLTQCHLLRDTSIMWVGTTPQLHDHLILLDVIEAEEVDIILLIGLCPTLEVELEELVIPLHGSICNKGICNVCNEGGSGCSVVVIVGDHFEM